MSFPNPNTVDNSELLPLGMVLLVMSDPKTDMFTNTYNVSDTSTWIQLFNTGNTVFAPYKGSIKIWESTLPLTSYQPVSTVQVSSTTNANKPDTSNLVKDNPTIPIDSNVQTLKTKLYLNLPDNIHANCKNGDTLPKGFLIVLHGDMKENDPIYLSRTGKPDVTIKVPNDCTYAEISYIIDPYDVVNVTYGNGGNGGDTRMNDVTTTPDPDPDPTPEKPTIVATYDLSNCTSNITDPLLDNKKYNFVITAKDGYEISGKASYYASYNNGASYETIIQYAEHSKSISFNADLSLANRFELNVNATQTAPDNHNIPTQFTHLYNPSDSDLSQLTTDVISLRDIENIGILNVGAYITTLYNIPYPIDPKILGNKEQIILATQKSSFLTPTILGNNFTIDLGKIRVNEQYKSNFDYSSTQCFLVCPYMDRIPLQIDDVIEHTLKLKFVINLYNGDCTLIVTSDDKLVYNSTFKLANKIPYVQSYVDNSNKNSTDNIIYNDVDTAYIEIIRPKPLKNAVVSTDEIGTLKDYKGFTAIKNVSLNTNASLSEQQEIETKLQTGVYIND